MQKYGKWLVICRLGICSFLVSARKEPKEAAIGGALNVALPRAKDAPSYVPLPSRTQDGFVDLNLPAVPEKSVPTFSRKRKFYSLRCAWEMAMRDWGFLRGRLWRAGARHAAPLKSASFGTFLAETRKVHLPACVFPTIFKFLLYCFLLRKNGLRVWMN